MCNKVLIQAFKVEEKLLLIYAALSRLSKSSNNDIKRLETICEMKRKSSVTPFENA